MHGAMHVSGVTRLHNAINHDFYNFQSLLRTKFIREMRKEGKEARMESQCKNQPAAVGKRRRCITLLAGMVSILPKRKFWSGRPMVNDFRLQSERELCRHMIYIMPEPRAWVTCLGRTACDKS
jgi:hypothetical protein